MFANILSIVLYMIHITDKYECVYINRCIIYVLERAYYAVNSRETFLQSVEANTGMLIE